INLITRTVSTLAGSVSVSGFADGTGSTARFSSPSGIALESETAIQALERERRGLPPPPVQMVVADTGNGAIRRVVDSGAVTTLRPAVSAISQLQDKGGIWQATAAGFISFNAPAGIAVDGAGNIFVTEPGSRQIRT